VEIEPKLKKGSKGIVGYINYPPMALENDIQGIVKIACTIAADGTVSNVRIVSDKLGYGLEEEALRVFDLLKKEWEPATRDGVPVSTEHIVPYKFQMF
jgi:TonB family protein